MDKNQKEKVRRRTMKMYNELVEDSNLERILSTPCEEHSASQSNLLQSDIVERTCGGFMDPVDPSSELNSVQTNLPSNEENTSAVIEDISPDFPVQPNGAAGNNIQTELRQWAVEENINHTSLNRLLQILRKHHNLPADARTLLKTPKLTPVTKMSNGEYWHCGLKHYLVEFIKRSNASKLDCSFNIDGLPLFNNSGQHAWPILGSLDRKSNPFLIGIWCGKGKPDLDLFLKYLIEELKELLSNGLVVNGITYPFNIRGFFCDAPARAYLKRIVSHNGYYGCEKCLEKGTYINTMTFQNCNAPLRTGDNFKNRLQREHHRGDSPLEEINLNLVDAFGLDYMHLVCLGVMKRLFNIWCFGELRHRLGRVEKNNISKVIKKFTKCTPKDFNRKVRPLEYVKMWKATEYRTFLIYIGPIALRRVLPKKKYQHFLLLSAAVSILIKQELLEKYANVAQNLLTNFVLQFKKLYGEQHLVYNVHNLIHLVKECENFGPLDDWSAFKYENYLGKIKKMLRSGFLPLQQIINRVQENQCTNICDKNVVAQKFLKVNGYIITNNFPNNYVRISNNIVCKIINIKDSSITVQQFENSVPLYKYPINSKIINCTYVNTIHKTEQTIDANEILNKCLIFPVETNKYACFSM